MWVGMLSESLRLLRTEGVAAMEFLRAAETAGRGEGPLGLN